MHIIFVKMRFHCQLHTFIDLDGDSGLAIRGCGEDLGFFGGHNGVSGDQFGHHSSNGLNTKSQGAHIQKNNITWKSNTKIINW